MPSTLSRLFCLVAAAAAPAAALAQAPVAAPPGPAARWHVDGASARCVLTRRLAGDPAPATFVLRFVPGSDRYDLILAGPSVPGEGRRLASDARMVLTLGEVRIEVPVSAIDLPGGVGSGVLIGPLPAEILPLFARSASLSLAERGGAPLGTWTIPVAARAAEALSYCEREKLIEWGADAAGFEAGGTRPRPLAGAREWITPRELGIHDPLGSMAYSAVFRLVIGTEGRVEGCTMLESAGNVDLGRGCRILERAARYEPARDAAGNPIRSVAIHIVSMHWMSDLRIIPG